MKQSPARVFESGDSKIPGFNEIVKGRDHTAPAARSYPYLYGGVTSSNCCGAATIQPAKSARSGWPSCLCQRGEQKAKFQHRNFALLAACLHRGGNGFEVPPRELLSAFLSMPGGRICSEPPKVPLPELSGRRTPLRPAAGGGGFLPRAFPRPAFDVEPLSISSGSVSNIETEGAR